MRSSGTSLGARPVRQALKVDTVWVFGDQLNLRIGALAAARPGSARVLMIESASKLTAAPWHVQRAHFLIASMRRFASEVAASGFEVDYRQAPTFAEGLAGHRAEFRPRRIIATEPNSHRARSLALGEDVVLVRSNQFLCHYEDFATWARSRKQLRLEDFYRRQRARLHYLMDDDGGPEGGRWNFDKENRRPPPRRGPYPWPGALTDPLDTLDHGVVAGLPSNCTGSPPTGLWATSRPAALRRLDHFIEHALPLFGPHEDAMIADHFNLAHSLLSPYLNNGLLLAREVADRAEAAYRAGAVPLASAEGFIRQLIGWREYVWGLYWLEPPSYASMNELGAMRPLPKAFTGGETKMECVRACLDGVEERSWLHHIQRLMVLGNLSLLAGIRPREVTSWMWERFVDGAEWVMVPNVIGMSLYADGGRMATKPYAAGGAYLSKMSTYCKGCSFEPKKRVGEDACPFTTLYWDFILRHAHRFEGNHRMVRQVRAAERLSDLRAVRLRATEVLTLLDEGRL
jgi:deoxyribodipyrimidine photolyase-related protein